MIYIDANVLIYLLEDTGAKGKTIAKTLSDIDEHHVRTSSVILLSEFLAGNDSATEALAYKVINGPIHTVDSSIAIAAGKLRREHKLKLGDSIHLATAIERRCDYFFTNDQKLARVAGHYLEVVSVDGE